MSPAAGARELEITVRGIVLQINARARSRAVRGVQILYNAAQVVLGQDGSGRTYGRHVASAPGQPPAPDTGNLRRNWRRRVFAAPNGKGLGITVRMSITSDMMYHDFLEKGTRYIAPRPFHNRIKTKARPKIVALFGSV